MASAESTWESLSDPWRAAFDEAWTSWSNGCFGIGAVAVGDDGEIACGDETGCWNRSGIPVSSPTRSPPTPR